MRACKSYALVAVSLLLCHPAFGKAKGPSGVSGMSSVSVSQHGVVNAAVVGQIGSNKTAAVTQSGIVNGAVIGQVGNNATASITQSGRINASAIGQGP